MKRIYILAALIFFLMNTAISQSNKFPASGNVGVGTTSPLTPIHIKGGTAMTAGWNKTSTLEATFPVQIFNSNNTKWAGIGYDHSTAMRIWVNSPNQDLPANGTHGLSILNNGNVGVGIGNPIAPLQVAQTAPYNAIDGPTGLLIYNPSISAANLAFGINGSGSNSIQSRDGTTSYWPLSLNPYGGYVGIGTSTPTYKLEAVTTGQTGFRLQTSASNVHNPQIDLYDVSNGEETVLSSTDGKTTGTYLASYSNHPLLFGTNHSQSQMMLATSGNVGIGTNTPSYKLEAVTTGQTGFRLQTSASNVPYPQIDLYDVSNGEETVLSSTDGKTTGTYLASYSNHPLLFGTNHSQSQMMLATSGNVGIGTNNPTEKLSVDGNIRAKKLIVTQTGWSDYVFYKNYKLRPLTEVEKFIKVNQHLPEMPTAKEVAAKGINVGDTQALLLKKIEELTLYVIDQEKKIQALREEQNKMREANKRIKLKLNRINN